MSDLEPEPQSRGCALPLRRQSRIRLRSQHGNYLQAPPLKKGLTENDFRLVDDHNAVGTEFLMERIEDDFFILYSLSAAAFVFVSTAKAGWGGGYKVKYSTDLPTANTHIWTENLERSQNGRFRLIPYGDTARSLVAGRLGLLPPRRGLAVKHYSRLQQNWDSWSFELLEDEAQVKIPVAIEDPVPDIAFISSDFQRKYTRFFQARPARRPRRLAVISPQSGQGKSSFINTCLERHAAHVSQGKQGTTEAADYPFLHGGVEWILTDIPGMSGSHDVPPTWRGNRDGTLKPLQFVRHYGLGNIDVDGILFIASYNRYTESLDETKALLKAVRQEAPETPILLVMTHAENKGTGLLSRHITNQLATQESDLNMPFFFVHTRLPASLPALASPAEEERHATLCRETATQNKQISDFPVLLDCLSMPVPERVPTKMVFQIMSREIVSQSLNSALRDFKPTGTSQALQLGAQLFLGPFVGGFVAFTTMSIAYQACKRLGLINAFDDDVASEEVKGQFRKIGQLGFNRVFRLYLKAYFFSAMPRLLFDEIFLIAMDLGLSEIAAGLGCMVGQQAIVVCMNAVMESKRWLRIAAVIRKHAFKSHMGWVIAEGNGLWLDF